MAAYIAMATHFVMAAHVAIATHALFLTDQNDSGIGRDRRPARHRIGGACYRNRGSAEEARKRYYQSEFFDCLEHEVFLLHGLLRDTRIAGFVGNPHVSLVHFRRPTLNMRQNKRFAITTLRSSSRSHQRLAHRFHNFLAQEAYFIRPWEIPIGGCRLFVRAE